MEFFSFPAPMCIIRDFLSKSEHEKIKEELKFIKPYLKTPEFTGSGVENGKMKAKRKGIFLNESHFLNGNSQINGILDKVLHPSTVDPLCEKNWIFEYLRNEPNTSTLISLFQEGDEYTYHKDQSVLSIIYYVFDGEFEGGELYIRGIKIPVKNNTLIIFPSCLDHTVSTLKNCTGERWSITTFFGLKPKFPIINKITSFTDFLHPDELKIVRDIIDNNLWSYTGQSISNGHKFWYMDLINNEFFTKTLFNKIPNGPWKIERVYANGQAFGQDGDFHQDSQNPLAYTFLLYITDVNRDLMPLWGGETEFITDYGHVLESPIPNKAILFPSNIFHRGYGPSRFERRMRVTVAWKLIKE